MIVIHVFTEEPSAKNVFEILLPKILPEHVYFKIYPHQGKQDLDDALKKTIPSISRIPGSKILITRDQDAGDCKEIKNEINQHLENTVKCEYYIRIVCRELESWFLGDLPAIKLAYPRFKPEQYAGKANMRNVDKLMSPNKYLLKIIPELDGMNYLPKLEVSNNISPFLNLNSNTSLSFNQTLTAISKLADAEPQNFKQSELFKM